MLLRRVRIENFRAVRRISLPLEETTVLVGENGSGKTSVLDALGICLGPSSEPTRFRFEERDFRRMNREGEECHPVSIRLEFAEREPGEWPEDVVERLKLAVSAEKGGRRALYWEIRACWNAETRTAETEWAFLDSAGRVMPQADDPSLPAALRELCPFLLLGEDPGRARTEPDGDGADGGARSAEGLLRRRGWTPEELEEATLEIWQKLSAGWDSLSDEDLAAGRAVSAQIWKQVIRRARDERDPRRRNARERLPSGGAQSLAPLLVFGAFLHAQGAEKQPVGAPLLAFDQIEVGLHPATLGAVWRVLDSVPGQKLVSTYSGEVLAAAPLHSLRRMVRGGDRTRVLRFEDHSVSREDLRRLRYHIRALRGGALFDRCWLLVEGETEFWLLPELARISGYDFASEGISCVEFAQCGLSPILALAGSLGIDRQVLVDGDPAGRDYARSAEEALGPEAAADVVTRLPAFDIETYLWESGYDEVYRAAAGRPKRVEPRRPHEKSRAVIAKAIRSRSKPYLALSVVEACAARGPAGVPPLLRRVIERVVRAARGG